MDDYTSEKDEVSNDEKTVEYGFDSCHYIDFWAFPTNKCMSFDVPNMKLFVMLKMFGK